MVAALRGMMLGGGQAGKLRQGEGLWLLSGHQEPGRGLDFCFFEGGGALASWPPAPSCAYYG